MKYTKHLEYGLPEFFIIKTNNGREYNWGQAIFKFNEIFESSWGGNSYNYYGYCGDGIGSNGTDCWDEHNVPNCRNIFTPTEFLNIVNKPKQNKMQYSLQDGDVLENVTAEQWEIIKSLAPQYGVEIYSETLKYGYPRSDYGGRLVFLSNKLQGSWDKVQILSFDQFILAMMGKSVPRVINVKLNDRYNAVVTKDEVVVGCQTFSHDVIKELYEAIGKV